MSSDRTTLRIRCGRNNFKKFKRIAADYDDYEKTLEMLMEAYEKYLLLYPEFAKVSSEHKGLRY